MARKKSNKTNKSAIKVARRLLERGLEHTCVRYPDWIKLGTTLYHSTRKRTGIDDGIGLESSTSADSEDATRKRHTPLHTTRSRLCRIEWHLRKVLETLGYNKGDEVYQRTPKRVAKAYILELFSGLDYGRFPRCSKFPIIIGINTRRRSYGKLDSAHTSVENKSVGNKSVEHENLEQNTAEGNSAEGNSAEGNSAEGNSAKRKSAGHPFVIVRDIPFTSMCEHHLLPFTGTITIGYKPRKYVIGLSKIPRVAQFFACRPQMQERLTCQILEALRAITHSKEAGIKIDAQHTCVCARGIKSDNVTTTYQLKHLSPNGLAMLFDK